MTDFGAAFEAGQNAAEQAAAARLEIEGVLEDLNRQLSKKTKNRLQVAVKDRRRDPSNLLIGFSIGLGPSREAYQALIARNPQVEGGTEVQLAEWSLDRAGYPCDLRWAKYSESCHDKESLERALARMLQDPIVAAKLKSIVSQEAKKPASERTG